MAQQQQPEWIQKAAQDVTAFVHQQQESAAQAAAQVKERLQDTQTKVKADVHQTQEKIADIIHRHFKEHK